MMESEFPRDDPDAAALAWFSRLRGPVSPAERAAFEAWLGASPAHRIAWRRVESLWAASGEAGQRVAAGDEPRLSAYLEKIRRARRRRALRQTGSALALALAILTGAMWLERPHFFQDLTADEVTARGERRLVTLPDASTVLLNADSALDVDFASGERRVRLLRGTAFFSVAKTGTPFTVEAAGGAVRVLGTQFDIHTADDGAVVTLAEGSVAVKAGAGEARLVPGQQVHFAARSLGEVRTADIDAALAWREGRLVFYGARLEDIITEIGRYRPGRIVITSRRLRDWVVSGSLPLDDPDAALRSLQSSVGFSMRSIAGRLIVLN